MVPRKETVKPRVEVNAASLNIVGGVPDSVRIVKRNSGKKRKGKVRTVEKGVEDEISPSEERIMALIGKRCWLCRSF